MKLYANKEPRFLGV